MPRSGLTDNTLLNQPSARNMSKVKHAMRVTAVGVLGALVMGSTAHAAGYSSWYRDNYPSGCYFTGIAKTYYDNGSSSSNVSVRARFYISTGGAYSEESWSPLQTTASGSGPREARVAHNQSYQYFKKLEARHWGTPWGSNSYLTGPNLAGNSGCG